jgi:hypothetical protein
MELVGALELLGLGFEVTPFLCCKIESSKVVKLLGEFKNSSEDVHLFAPHAGSVTRASYWLPFISSRFNLAPLLTNHVEAPQIVQLVVFIFLTTKCVEFVAMASERHTCSLAGFGNLFIISEDLAFKCGSTEIKLAELAHSRALHEASESDETSIVYWAHSMVISRNYFALAL